MKRLFLVICGVLFCAPCFAGGTYIGLIKPQLWGGGLYLYLVNMSYNQPAACSTRAIVVLQDASSTQAYKDKYAMILTAWYTQTPLVLLGTGTCDGEGDEMVFAVNPQ